MKPAPDWAPAPPKENEVPELARAEKMQWAMMAREEAFLAMGKPARGSKNKGAWGRRGEARVWRGKK